MKKRIAIICAAVITVIILAFAARVAPVTQAGAVRMEMLRMGYVSSAMFSRLEPFRPYGEHNDGGFLASWRPVTLVPCDWGSDSHLDQWNVVKNGWFYSASFGRG